MVKTPDFESENSGLSPDEAAKWRPMKEAPKDGTWFIGRKDGVELRTQWGKTSHVPLYGWCFYLSDYGEPDYDLWQPTEWRRETVALSNGEG